MEGLKNNESYSNSNLSLSLPSNVKNVVMAVSLGLMAVFGGGCSEKPDSMDKCLGAGQASEHKSRLKEMEKVCGQRVNDYVTGEDWEKRDMLGNDAQLACGAYADEMVVTRGILDAKKESARKVMDWYRRDNCSAAIRVLDKRTEKFKKGDMFKLTNK
ncbi:hypothetical protein C0416_03740 [bacterium]|nr:hypothetical protein [bacterium]